MIEVQQIADFLNTELNNIGKSQGYNFDIKAEVGKRTNENAIYGIVTTTKADARVDENVDYVFAVELSVPSAQSNENVINVEKIIGEFKNKFHMKNRAFGGGQGTLLISLATPKDYQIKYVVGDDVPLVFTITTEYIRNAVGSGDKHWLLNGMEIPFINESVSVQKEGRTNTIHGESYTKTLLTRQTRYYKFGFDYDNSELCIMLKKDLLDGKYDKVYTLTYYDGVSFTEENPFTTSVSIFANGQSSSTKPNVSEFEITFTDVDNEEEAEYFMALIDNPFDSTTENTLYFETEEKQREYYQSKIDKDVRWGGVGCDFVKIKAPNLSSIDITNQVYEIPLNDGKPIYDVFSVTNKNYAIIKVKKGEDEQWFYYYVSNQNIGGQNQVMFDLKLDSIQTYCIGDKLQFGDCLIERGHENRWIDNGDGTVSFDGTIDSKLFERENIQNVAKRLTKRTKIGQIRPSQFTNMSKENAEELANWLNNKIACWVYIYCVPSGSQFQTNDIFNNSELVKYNFRDIKGNEKSIGLPETQVQSLDHESLLNFDPNNFNVEYHMPTNVSVLCYPILKDDKTIRFEAPTTDPGIDKYVTYWGERKLTNVDETTILSQFANKNSGYLKFLTVQLSYTSPILDAITAIDDEKFKIDSEGLKIITTIQTGSGDGFPGNSIINTLIKNSAYGGEWAGNMLTVDGGHGQARALGFLFEINGLKTTNEYSTTKNLTFNKSDLIDKPKNPQFNPKLLSSDYFELSIGDNTENGYVYDLQKLNTKTFNLSVSNTLMPGLNKNYIRINNPTGVYVRETEYNLTGFISSDESTVTMPTSAYQSMLVQNKNYFLQNSINRGMDIARSVPSIAQSIGTGDYVNAGMQTFNTALNYVQNKINENLTVDNLKNAPANVIQAKGDILFQSACSNLGIYVEEYDILDNEKEIINDYMCKYGFTVNRFGNPKDYDNIRHYYNYVKAQIDSISGIAISNQARDDIRQRFANGVRFWKQDNIDYSMENYEEWLAQ